MVTKNFPGLTSLKVEAQGVSLAERIVWVKVRPADIQELLQIIEVARHHNKCRVFRLSRICSQEAILQKLDHIKNLPFDSAIFVDMSLFNKIVEHTKEDQVISVETGMSLSALNEYLQKNSQWFPASSIFKEDSVIDFVDEAAGGHNLAGYGGARGIVLGLSCVLSSGDLITTGGKVVKNVTGYDLSKLFVGGQGIFGLAYQVNLRLFVRPLKQKLQVFAFSDLRQALFSADKLERLAQKISGQASVQLIDTRLLTAAMPSWNQIVRDNATAEEALFRLKSAFKGNEKTYSYLVFFQTSGHPDVVSQMVQEGEALSCGASVWEFEDGSASYLCDFVGQAADLVAISAGSAQLSISSSRRALDRLMTDTLPELDVYWYCHRPSGKLTLVHEKGELSLWLEKIRKSSESFSIAYSSPEYFKCVEKKESTDSYPEHNLAVRAGLITELKSKFDPHNLFNPLHKFEGGGNSA